MKLFKFSIFIFTFFILFSNLYSEEKINFKTFADLSIPEVPEWSNRYADDEGDNRFFKINNIMKKYKLSRLAAVEVQNHYRDIIRKNINFNKLKAFNIALDKAKKGIYESKVDEKKLKTAKFIIVFDLDETLYQQYYKSHSNGEKFYDISYKIEGTKWTKYIKLTPYYLEIIKKIKELGGISILFSANTDNTTWTNIKNWKTKDGLQIETLVEGVLSNSYLIRQTKYEQAGEENYKKGMVVLEPSKDLRLFDENLEKTIIVDDNPNRIFQMKNYRLIKKFEADEYLSAKYLKKEEKTEKFFDNILKVVCNEIEESCNYMEKNKVKFARAYLPYTVLGQIGVNLVKKSLNLNEKEAIEHIRKHPELISDEF